MQRLSDAEAEMLGREWCEKRGKKPWLNQNSELWTWWSEGDDDKPVSSQISQILDDLICNQGYWFHTDGYAYIALGHSLHACWLACGGEERVAAAVAAERERCLSLLRGKKIHYLYDGLEAMEQIRKGESQRRS